MEMSTTDMFSTIVNSKQKAFATQIVEALLGAVVEDNQLRTSPTKFCKLMEALSCMWTKRPQEPTHHSSLEHVGKV